MSGARFILTRCSSSIRSETSFGKYYWNNSKQQYIWIIKINTSVCRNLINETSAYGVTVILNRLFWKYSYEVEFSKPKVDKPIPEGTVKVYFNIIEAEDGKHEVEFNFENESLKHRPGNTMRNNMYEVSSAMTSIWNPIYFCFYRNGSITC